MRRHLNQLYCKDASLFFNLTLNNSSSRDLVYVKTALRLSGCLSDGFTALALRRFSPTWPQHKELTGKDRTLFVLFLLLVSDHQAKLF